MLCLKSPSSDLLSATQTAGSISCMRVLPWPEAIIWNPPGYSGFSPHNLDPIPAFGGT